MTYRETIDCLRRRLAQHKASHKSVKDIEVRLVLLVAKQLRREIRAERKQA